MFTVVLTGFFRGRFSSTSNWIHVRRLEKLSLLKFVYNSICLRCWDKSEFWIISSLVETWIVSFVYAINSIWCYATSIYFAFQMFFSFGFILIIFQSFGGFLITDCIVSMRSITSYEVWKSRQRKKKLRKLQSTDRKHKFPNSKGLNYIMYRITSH